MQTAAFTTSKPCLARRVQAARRSRAMPVVRAAAAQVRLGNGEGGWGVQPQARPAARHGTWAGAAGCRGAPTGAAAPQTGPGFAFGPALGRSERPGGGRLHDGDVWRRAAAAQPAAPRAWPVLPGALQQLPSIAQHQRAGVRQAEGGEAAAITRPISACPPTTHPLTRLPLHSPPTAGGAG